MYIVLTNLHHYIALLRFSSVRYGGGRYLQGGEYWGCGYLPLSPGSPLDSKEGGSSGQTYHWYKQDFTIKLNSCHMFSEIKRSGEDWSLYYKTKFLSNNVNFTIGKQFEEKNPGGKVVKLFFHVHVHSYPSVYVPIKFPLNIKYSGSGYLWRQYSGVSRSNWERRGTENFGVHRVRINFGRNHDSEYLFDFPDLDDAPGIS